MSVRSNEEALDEAASRAHPDEQVLAAGVFSWQNLLGAQVVGLAAGGVAGDLAGDLAGGGAGEVAGAVVGSHAATTAMAQANGMTVGLLVAVTPDNIYIHNLNGDVAGPLVGSYPRASTQVTIKKMGLSRVVHLDNDSTGDHLSLHGSVSPLSAQSKPDKVVMALISEHG